MTGVLLGFGRLAFLFFDFVAAEVFLGFGENNVFAQDWVVLPESQFIRGIHGIFLGVILANTGLFGDETY